MTLGYRTAPAEICNNPVYRTPLIVLPLVVAIVAFLSFTQSTSAEEAEEEDQDFCWEEWTLCEGSVPCPVEICVKDLVASIECSRDDTCEDNKAEIPKVFATRLEHELSKPGGFIVGRRSGAAEAEEKEAVLCWRNDRGLVCDSVSSIINDCSINPACDKSQTGTNTPKAVLDRLKVLYASRTTRSDSQGSPWSYDACCKRCDCSIIPCICYECYDKAEGKDCPKGFANATCESDGNGTTCLNEPDQVQGCCVSCPTGKPCEHCASAPHSFCGGLLKANCGLYNDKFICQPAAAVIPINPRAISPNIRCSVPDKRQARPFCSLGAVTDTGDVCIGGKYDNQPCDTDEAIRYCELAGGICMPPGAAAGASCSQTGPNGANCTCKCSGAMRKLCNKALKAGCQLASNCDDKKCDDDRGCTWTGATCPKLD